VQKKNAELKELHKTLLRRRWVIAFWAVAMQTMLGTAYAWSIFKNPLQQLHHWSSAELSLPFSLMIFFLGVSAAFGGKFVDKAGVRKVALLAGLLFGTGTLLTGYSISIQSLPLLLLSYGVIAGIGNGLGYITPVAVLVRWFPDKRGFITGIAVMGFGFGAGFIGQIAPFLIKNFGLSVTFYILGLLYLSIMLPAALCFANPPKNWKDQFESKKKTLKKAARQINVTLGTVLQTRQFYIMWLVFFVNICAGVALLSNLSPLAQARFHVTPISAGTLVLLTSLFNGLGRVFWSTLSEKIGRKITFMVIIYSQIPFLFLLPITQSYLFFSVMSCYIIFCMGGGFSTMPAFAADIFGVKHMGNIYGKFLLAWSAAGVLGPLLMEAAKANWGDFDTAFYILGITFLCIYIPLSHFLMPIESSQIKSIRHRQPFSHLRKNVAKLKNRFVEKFIAKRITAYMALPA
jgi:MFS transporter, OFA family, oxalate/formate antiporter